MAEVKHHLIDILDIEDEYSVKQFQQQGRFLIQRMIDEYKMPIIVGGTGLYLKSLYYDYEFSDEQVDEEYQAFLKVVVMVNVMQCCVSSIGMLVIRFIK